MFVERNQSASKMAEEFEALLSEWQAEVRRLINPYILPTPDQVWEGLEETDKNLCQWAAETECEMRVGTYWRDKEQKEYRRIYVFEYINEACRLFFAQKKKLYGWELTKWSCQKQSLKIFYFYFANRVLPRA